MSPGAYFRNFTVSKKSAGTTGQGTSDEPTIPRFADLRSINWINLTASVNLSVMMTHKFQWILYKFDLKFSPGIFGILS